MIRAAALGLTLVLTTLLTGCGIVVVDEAPTDVLSISAPVLVQVAPEVDGLGVAPARTASLGRARRVARQAALEIVIPECDDDPKGRGFGVDAHTLVAHEDVVEGGGSVRVSTANRRSTAVGAAGAYRIGDLAVARVARTLPRKLRLGRSVAAGASVVVVAERTDKLHVFPGQIVDSVPGAPYGAFTKVLRLTSAVRDGDAGPVLDANGRVVAVLFAVDPRTTLGVALPVAALRGRAPARTLEALDSCD